MDEAGEEEGTLHYCATACRKNTLIHTTPSLFVSDNQEVQWGMAVGLESEETSLINCSVLKKGEPFSEVMEQKRWKQFSQVQTSILRRDRWFQSKPRRQFLGGSESSYCHFWLPNPSCSTVLQRECDTSSAAVIDVWSIFHRSGSLNIQFSI